MSVIGAFSSVCHTAGFLGTISGSMIEAIGTIHALQLLPDIQLIIGDWGEYLPLNASSNEITSEPLLNFP